MVYIDLVEHRDIHHDAPCMALHQLRECQIIILIFLNVLVSVGVMRMNECLGRYSSHKLDSNGEHRGPSDTLHRRAWYATHTACCFTCSFVVKLVGRQY